jgi:uncharacterized membrane protein YgcG
MIRDIAVADFTVTAFSIIVETIERNVATGLALALTLNVAFFTTGLTLTLNVAFFTTGLTLTLNVAFFTTGLTLTLNVAFFTTGAVLRTVRRRMSGFFADSAGLVQEHWAHDFSIGSGLVFDKVAGIFRFRTSGITTHLTEGFGGDDGTGGGGGGISGGGGRER